MLGLDRDRVELAAHHDAWRVAFAEEADRLRDALGDRIVVVGWIGSTAIPGVPAKPVLDLLVTVPSEERDAFDGTDDTDEGHDEQRHDASSVERRHDESSGDGHASDLAAARELLPAIESLGYTRRETPVPGRLFLVRGPPEARTHYLSLAPHGGTFHREKLAFREYLREYPRVAAEYARLKRALADAHGDDRDAYTEGKSAFIDRVLDDALPEYAP